MKIKSIISHVKAWWNRMSELKKMPVAIPEPVHEHHVCLHCGYGYDGRCCPQCGMPAGHVRFTPHRLIYNFLDIWGLGNRPMFRTMRDLLWRPGYMIRDYLQGHHLSYFPPFKMLAVLTVFIVVISWMLNVTDDSSVAQKIANALLKIKENTDGETHRLTDGIVKAIFFIGSNDLYRILTQNIFVVLSAWIVFRKKGFNLVETFFSQVYINCQFHMLSVVWILCTMQIPPSELFPYMVPLSITLPVLIYDYMQLYGIKFWKSLWKTILFFILTFLFYIVFIVALLFTVYLVEEHF